MESVFNIVRIEPTLKSRAGMADLEDVLIAMRAHLQTVGGPESQFVASVSQQMRELGLSEASP